MAQLSTQSIVINAPAESIMAVIADFEAYPQWAGSIKSATPVEDSDDGLAARVTFSMDAGLIKDTYTLDYDWSGYPNTVSWSLVEGQMQKGQQGSYSLSEQGDRTTTTYTLEVELNIPMLGMMKRKAEKVIMDTALRELKRRVESLG